MKKNLQDPSGELEVVLNYDWLRNPWRSQKIQRGPSGEQVSISDR